MVAVAAKAGDVTATWDFKTMAAGAVHYEGNAGTVASDVEGVELTVDATNKGKLKSRGSDAQFNKNTIIRIPVKSTKDHVSIISYPGYHNYTVGGIAADADTVWHKATTQEVESGYVEVVGTGGSYLYKIQVTHVSPLQEKVIYETDFTNWEAIDRKANNETPTVLNLSTKYSHEDFTFTLCGVGADPEGTNNKFPDITGYMTSTLPWMPTPKPRS